jgi:uncharacterized membrane protein YcfT
MTKEKTDTASSACQFKARGITTVYVLAHETSAAIQTLTDTHRQYDDHTNHVKDVTVVLNIPMPLLLSARMAGYHLRSVKKRSNT